ncbi:hypothetical protein GHT06_013366 [Daphnia sinensis]|uniref:Uncharacterized protein n=1 Tax=Daphnia sinensis TaxID=1820382 RepID=A0AAD5PWZ5_9CRUS|nr:hypothetical protein GHT06_013366 [Daphnia sinensis]
MSSSSHESDADNSKGKLLFTWFFFEVGDRIFFFNLCHFRRRSADFPSTRSSKALLYCTKAQGVSRNLTIQHYSTPSAPVLKRLTGKLVVLVPLKASLPYESDFCQQTVPIRQWAHHIDRCTEQAFRTNKRKTY